MRNLFIQTVIYFNSFVLQQTGNRRVSGQEIGQIESGIE